MVPNVIPVTTPEPEPTEAVDVPVLVQVPPEVALVSVTEAPGQTDELPVIAAGDGRTVNTSDPAHPPGVI